MIWSHSHGRTVLSTHGFGISDLKAAVSDAGLRLFPGEDLFFSIGFIAVEIENICDTFVV